MLGTYRPGTSANRCTTSGICQGDFTAISGVDCTVALPQEAAVEPEVSRVSDVTASSEPVPHLRVGVLVAASQVFWQADFQAHPIAADS